MQQRALSGVPEELQRRLGQLERRIRGLAFLRGLGLLCAVVCGGVMLSLLIDWAADLGVAVRSVLLLAVLLAGVVTAVQYVIRPLLRKMSPAEVAALVDTAHPELREQLESSIELNDPSSPEAHRGSPLMRSLLAGQVEQTARSVNFQEAADATRTTRWVVIGLVTLLLVVAPLGATKTGYGVLLSRFLTPWRNHERVTNLMFHIVDGDRAVARGSDVTIAAEPQWRFVPGDLPEFVWIEWQDALGESDSRRMTFDAERNGYVSTFPHVLSSFDFDVSAGRSRTQMFHVEVVEAPEITRLALDVHPPAYTGLPAESLDGAAGRIAIFAGSRLSFQMTFSRPVTQAALEEISSASMSSLVPAKSPLDEEPSPALHPMTLSADGLAGFLDFIPGKGGPFVVRLLDALGVENQDPTVRWLDVHADKAPDLEWTDVGPADDDASAIEVRLTDQVPIGVHAIDDVAVAGLELHLQVVQRGEALEPLKMSAALLGHADVQNSFVIDMSAYPLQQGDLLAIRARAVDNRPHPGPNETWSAPRLISVRSDADPLGLSDLLQRQQDFRHALDALRQQVASIRVQVTGLRQSTQDDHREKRPFSHPEELRRAERDDEDVLGRIEQLAVAFEGQALYRGLAEPLREVGKGPIVQARNHLQQASGVELAAMPEPLQHAVDQHTDAERQLAELAKQFEELARLEQDLMDLQRLADAAKKLSDDTQELEQQWEALRNDQSLTPEQRQAREEVLEQQRQALQDRQQSLASALNDLLEERPEILQAARQQQFALLRQLGEQALQLAEPQDQLAEAFDREAPDESAPPQGDPLAEAPENTRALDEPASDQPPPAAEGIEETSDPASPATLLAQSQERLQQLAEAAVDLTLKAARREGVDSTSAQEAREFAEQTHDALQQAQTGQLTAAAESAARAAEQARSVAEAFEGRTDPTSQELGSQADQLAGLQQELADQLSQLAASPQMQQVARAQGQQNLESQTSELVTQLENVARNLGSEPLNEPQVAERAATAQQTADEARATMSESRRQGEQGNSQEAGQQARQAAESLRQTAQQAGAAAPEGSPPSPVPGEVGEQLAEAQRQLQQAGEQLAQNPGSNPAGSQSPNGDPSGSEMAQNGQSPGDPQPAAPDGQNAQETQAGTEKATDPAGSTPQEGSNAQQNRSKASESMQRVADALQQAAQGLGLPSPSSPDNAQQAASGSEQNGASGTDGSGARTSVRLVDIESQLKGLSTRQWGELPGTLRTELLQSNDRRPADDYAPLIRDYFEHIRRRQAPLDTTAPE